MQKAQVEKKRDTRIKKRTKSGCLTCRKRRIKCDEGKPSCGNCIRSKRSCEGYPTPSLRDPLSRTLEKKIVIAPEGSVAPSSSDQTQSISPYVPPSENGYGEWQIDDKGYENRIRHILQPSQTMSENGVHQYHQQSYGEHFNKFKAGSSAPLEKVNHTPDSHWHINPVQSYSSRSHSPLSHSLPPIQQIQSYASRDVYTTNTSKHKSLSPNFTNFNGDHNNRSAQSQPRSSSLGYQPMYSQNSPNPENSRNKNDLSQVALPNGKSNLKTSRGGKIPIASLLC